MISLRLSLLLCCLGACNVIAAGHDDAHIVIVNVSWERTYGGWQAVGRGNVDTLSGDRALRGFVFTASCDRRFLPSDTPESMYNGYWKKPNRLILEAKEIGGTKTFKCELKVDLLPHPYVKQ